MGTDREPTVIETVAQDISGEAIKSNLSENEAQDTASVNEIKMEEFGTPEPAPPGVISDLEQLENSSQPDTINELRSNSGEKNSPSDENSVIDTSQIKNTDGTP